MLVRAFYRGTMSKRVVMIVAALLVVGFLIYVGVSSFDGSYGQAAAIGGADVTAARHGNALVTKLRAVSGVTSVSFGFTSGLVADRKSTMRVATSRTIPLNDVDRVVELARQMYTHGVGEKDGAVLEVASPGAPELTVTSFSMSSEQLAADLTAWQSLRQSMGSTVTLELASSNRRTLTFVSRSGASFPWISAHYTLLKSLAAKGFTWSDPGVCDVGELPDVTVIALLSQLAAIVPVVPCNTSKSESGLAVTTAGVLPSVILGFVKGSDGVPFASHASQFSRVAAVLLSPEAPNVNVGFFGVSKGKLTVLRFFTGTCASGMVTHTDPTDATSLAILKAHGVDIATRATLGTCATNPATPSASPTPSG